MVMVQPEYSYYYPRRRSHAVVSTDVIATAAGITARGRHGIVAVAVAVVFVTTTTAAAARDIPAQPCIMMMMLSCDVLWNVLYALSIHSLLVKVEFKSSSCGGKLLKS